MLVECSVSQHHITSIGISKKIGSTEWKQKNWRRGCQNKSGRKKSKDGFGSGLCGKENVELEKGDCVEAVEVEASRLEAESG